ncbi:NAD(P)-binding protein [Hypoxylon trugodes]|uniref:NAD(P)-binding protein n=1 Tax=Hypoxylon trugodes TaxID=326681 RepID=UPI00218CBCA4|nr:NAD(P)-binding protein [Hypoxylon trugodes]KAI1388231.1 NAD(P)-binding protein [Hypoxylon trugodes]
MSTPTIAITGASGKLGGATLSALLSLNLLPPSSIVALTSSQPDSSTWAGLASQHPELQVRHATFEDPTGFEKALQGVDRLFLVSTPHIALDFDEYLTSETGEKKWKEIPDGQGREKHHRVAIDAAVRVGVKHVYYSSLAYAWDPQTKSPSKTSKAGVMRAHLRTEAYLSQLKQEGKLEYTTFIREGLYNESWPLYLGYFNPENDDRTVVPLAGDGKVAWTSIKDLGIGSALVLVAPSREYDGKTFYLSANPKGAKSLKDIAALVRETRGKGVETKIVGRDEHERYYVEERERDRRAVHWWVSTYDALEAGECLVDDPVLEKLLESVGVKPTPMEDTVVKMVKGE